MKRAFVSILFLIPLLLSAQTAASIPDSPDITRGVLPNGIAYYLMSNPSMKGFADYALVQPGMAGNPALAESLSKQTPFGDRKPYSYLASKGVKCRPEGYVSTFGDAAVLRLEDVPVFDRNVADSALLLVFGSMLTSPMEQYLVISGDIDKASVAQQIKMLALSVPQRTASYSPKPSEWVPGTDIDISFTKAATHGLSLLTLSFETPRLPADKMKGTQPFVSKVFAARLCSILDARVQDIFEHESIPFTSAETFYEGSLQKAGNERYSISIGVDSADLHRAVGTLSRILSDISSNGVGYSEFSQAKSTVMQNLVKEAGTGVTSNREVVQRCINACLLGASLASPSSVRDYFGTRVLDASFEFDLFNNFCRSILDSSSGLSLAVSHPGEAPDPSEIRRAFRESWNSGTTLGYEPFFFSGFPKPSGKKVKIKGTAPEAVSGGEIWTFAGGFKVIFRRMSGVSDLRYALLLRGGLPSIPGLAAGESALVPDVLGMFDVAGMTPAQFVRALESKGISMRADINLTDLTLRGSVAKDSFGELLQAFSSIADQRSFRSESLGYLRSCVSLAAQNDRLGSEGLFADMESRLAPDYDYLSVKNPDLLTPSLVSKVGSYLDTQFSKMDDGALVIVGDIDPSRLKEILSRYVGSFRTGRRYASRARVEYPLLRRWYTTTVPAEKVSLGDPTRSVSVLVSAMRPFSMKSMMSFGIACEILESGLEASLADAGMSVRTVTEISSFPLEKVSIRIEARACPAGGLPGGITTSSELAAVAAVRGALARYNGRKIDSKTLEFAKKAFLNKLESSLADPDFLVDAALLKTSGGKDIITGYKNQVSGVKAADVEAVLRDLALGSRVEYIVR